MAGISGIHVCLTHADNKSGRLYYQRSTFAGKTVADAIEALNCGDQKKGALPKGRYITAPFRLNGEPISPASVRILRHADSIRGRMTYQRPIRR